MAKKQGTGAALTFTKSELMKSKRYILKRDILGALLSDDRRYTVREADTLIEQYMKGKVN